MHARSFLASLHQGQTLLLCHVQDVANKLLPSEGPCSPLQVAAFQVSEHKRSSFCWLYSAQRHADYCSQAMKNNMQR